jgi:hypothetical protein
MYECQDDNWKELIKVLQHKDKPDVSAGLQVLLRIGKAGIVWSGKAIVDPFGDNAIPDEMKTSSPPKAKTPVDGK